MLYKLPLIVAAILVCTVPHLGFAQTQGQEFRLETQIYLGDSTDPVATNLTLFSAGMIYDFQMSKDVEPEPVEVVILDLRKKSFVLIDLERNQRAKIENAKLMQMLEGLRMQTSQSEKAKFLVNDRFKESFDITTNIAELKSDNIEYKMKGERPDDGSVLPTYFEFVDSFTFLQASDPTKLPPFPRFRLNQMIKKLGWMPTEIEVRLMKNQLFASEIKMRSEHTMIPRLSEKDKERIQMAKNAWMKSKVVGLSAYRSLNTGKLERLADRVRPSGKGR